MRSGCISETTDDEPTLPRGERAVQVQDLDFDPTVVPLEDARALTRVSLRKGDLRRAQNILWHASRIRSHPSFQPPTTKVRQSVSPRCS